jgi:hypothetical protein
MKTPLLTILGCLVLLGCDNNSGGEGVGGTTGGLGGNTGVGGLGGLGTGGAPVTGGIQGAGGREGTGGISATGGRDTGSIPGMGGKGMGGKGTGGISGMGGKGTGGKGTGGISGMGGKGTGATGGRPGTGGSQGSGGTLGTGGNTGIDGGGGGGTIATGWLYTQGNKVYVSDGSSGTVWTGRGVNIDDLFLCGYNSTLSMDSSSGEKAMLEMFAKMMTEWKPTFVRVSLGMNSYTVVSWIGSSKYKTAMTNVINSIGAYPGTYVLVTLRSDTTMVDTDGAVCGQNDDAVCLPTNATDDVYRELVSTFGNAPYVLFGIANEPGGMSAKDKDLSNTMSHAVAVIREQEDKLGVPHHIVAVQGNQWTSRIGFYNSAPLPYDNVVYEYHSYPPEATGEYGYTQSNIPVIIGEYGPLNSDLTFADTFLVDIEGKQIPSLAWDLSPYSNCAPDLVQVTHSSTLTANDWGKKVKNYLLAH